VRSLSRSISVRERMAQRLKWAVGLAAIAVVLFFVFLFDAADSTFYPPCVFHVVSGLHCPGCGSARALHQLLHGNLLTALSTNALVILSLPFLGYSLVSYTMLVTRGRRLPGVFLQSFWIWLLLAGILLYWFLRNIPLYPFSRLAP